jgi:hypothetical protein
MSADRRNTHRGGRLRVLDTQGEELVQVAETFGSEVVAEADELFAELLISNGELTTRGKITSTPQPNAPIGWAKHCRVSPQGDVGRDAAVSRTLTAVGLLWPRLECGSDIDQ